MRKSIYYVGLEFGPRKWFWANIFTSMYRHAIELSVKSPLLHPIFGLAFTLYPLLWYPQSKEILFNLSMKCWNLAFNAQGSSVIIVVLLFGVVEIYVATMEALRKKKDKMNLSLPPILVGKLVSVPLFSFPIMCLIPYYQCFFVHSCIVA
jgi:hypothetical protein